MKSHINANFVKNSLLILQFWYVTEELTLAKSLMSVKFVTSDLPKNQPSKHIGEFTPEKCLTNVNFAKNNSSLLQILQYIKEFTPEKSLTNVNFVLNDSFS